LAPEWAEMATNLKGEVKVAKVDATENKESAGKFGVSGYPTIKFFPGGKKDDSSAIDYNGPRTASAMADWAR
jgi:protein disulfide-isomerase A6